MEGCTVFEHDKKRHCFGIQTPQRTYFVAASSTEEMNSWMTAIKSVKPTSSSYRIDKRGSNSSSKFHFTPPGSPVEVVTKKGHSHSVASIRSDNSMGGEGGSRSGSVKSEVSHFTLTPEQEYDIALSATEIFLKDPAYRTPEEKAYIYAMQEYFESLEAHYKKLNVKPSFGLATGTALFCKKEKTDSDKLYISEMKRRYLEDVLTDIQPSVEDQVDAVKISMDVLEKEQKTKEEIEYIKRCREALKEIRSLEIRNGLKAQYSYILGQLILLKYPESYNLEDLEFLQEIK